MTRLGKVLVFVNLVFSVTVAVVALALYATQRLAAATPKQNRSQAEAAERVSREQSLSKALADAQKRWRGDHDELVKLEQNYYAHPPWYAARLKDLEDGKGELRAFTYANGQLRLEGNKPEGRPDLSASAKVENYNVYRQKRDAEAKRVLDGSTEILASLGREASFTNLLTGPKGLRVKIEGEHAKKKTLEAEAEDLKAFWTKTRVDSDILLRRQRQMEERIRELQKVLGETPGTR